MSKTETERDNNDGGNAADGTSNTDDGIMCLASGVGTVRTGCPCKRNTNVPN